MSDTRGQYTATIGIECHVQLKTKSKLFSAADNDAREAAPNTLVNHIDFGLPGALPVLNEMAVELASKAAFALNTTPQVFSKFDRKHYFYPDLPMGYQITQFDEPIILGGHVDIVVNGEVRRIGVTRAHLEADAGKSTHPAGAEYSLVDLNRAGTPLLEIVSEPDMHTAAEAKAYAYELYLAMKYAEVSYANLFYGNMRFDVNVSVSKSSELGTRTETKNLNSFRSVEKAVEYEIERQVALLENGEQVVQETRGWDDGAQQTFSQRTKEDAHDYRYMPDPDLPPVELSPEYIDTIRQGMPVLPAVYRQELADIGLDTAVIEDIIAVPETAKLVLHVLESAGPEHAKRITFWMMLGDTAQNEDEPTEEKTTSQNEFAARYITLSQMVADNKLSSTAAKEVFAEVQKTGENPERIAESKNLLQVSDEGAVAKIVGQVIAANEAAAADIKRGEMKVIGFLVGQVMKASQGKANPALATQLIKKQLGV
ncbi:MAG: aspartyl-tRNA(Asn)/glutamyl-tRNA(Gln) amidotransferase subunit [Patescibacteria group bacterium]|nr:Asp-tRNA(Asn)/Glu-tRNA(Gln) amidotransferase subunit GatB [Candidatus Saccharibacteria bacterium]MDQ5962985.1 aspartyl-tRNA(Asn)/glutamyl-tRNA(Gln) amidotransferase subunit [Patescibacteria group bacterium]